MKNEIFVLRSWAAYAAEVAGGTVGKKQGKTPEPDARSESEKEHRTSAREKKKEEEGRGGGGGGGGTVIGIDRDFPRDRPRRMGHSCTGNRVTW